jgi:H+-transporting ATPase
MAPNIKKVKMFRQQNNGQSAPEYTNSSMDSTVNADLESGSFLTESQRNNAVE